MIHTETLDTHRTTGRYRHTQNHRQTKLRNTGEKTKRTAKHRQTHSETARYTESQADTRKHSIHTELTGRHFQKHMIPTATQTDTQKHRQILV